MAGKAVELTILMPCLNEAETLGGCIDQALGFFARTAIKGEILIADNGSTDGSLEIAGARGARVVNVAPRGYGAALIAGIEAARGRLVIMGDCDASYDFSRLDEFVALLRDGADLVMGNRFKGGIAPGAMPFLHRYLGSPVLSFLGRIFYKVPVGDFNCGLRGFDRAAILALRLKAPGMEFASEMLVRAALTDLDIREVNTTLKPDGRSRAPHLNTWQDGWRHLRYLLLLSPRWLFFYPGLLILTLGAVLTLALLQGPVTIAPNVTLDIHSLIVGCLAILAGTQTVSFAVVARRYGALRGLLPSSSHYERYIAPVTLEWLLLAAGAIFLIGLAGFGYCLWLWVSAGFGPLKYSGLIRVLAVSGTALALGLQLAFTSFLLAIIEQDAPRLPRDKATD
jgi:glycosyltransferase involved in cell wall biosynthesis